MLLFLLYVIMFVIWNVGLIDPLSERKKFTVTQELPRHVHPYIYLNHLGYDNKRVNEWSHGLNTIQTTLGLQITEL